MNCAADGRGSIFFFTFFLSFLRFAELGLLDGFVRSIDDGNGFIPILKFERERERERERATTGGALWEFNFFYEIKKVIANKRKSRVGL